MNFDLTLGKTAAVLFLALAMAGCGGGGTTTPEPEPPPPAPIEVERMTISDAIAAASAAAGMVTDASTDAEVMAADAAVAAAMAAINGATLISGGEIATNRASLAMISSQLATAKASRDAAMSLAMQRDAISSAIAAAMTAVGMVADDSDDATVMAAQDAIDAATAAIDAATTVLASETTMARADVAGIQSSLDAAKTSRQMAMDEAARLEAERIAMEARRDAQLTAITMAIDAATTAVNAVNDASSAQEVADANAAVMNARAKIAEAADVADSVKAGHTATVDTLATSLANAEMSRNDAIDLAGQRMAISDAIAAARTAVGMVNDDSDDATVQAAEDAIADARVAIAGQADVPQAEKDANSGTVGEIMAQLDAAKMSRDAAIAAKDEAEKEAERMANEAMAATAAKLYAGISAPTGDADAATRRHAAYPADNDNEIVVTIGDSTDGMSATLTADDTMVAANHGWEGTRFTAEPDGEMGTYEAVVYSNVGEPTQGAMFNDSANGGYTLNADDELADVTSVTDYAGLVDSPSFDQSAGAKTFELPDNTVEVRIAGTFNGVAGTYSCTPAADPAVCTATVAASGFTLSGGTWMFKPTDPESRLMNQPDAIYSSYGWWIHKSENGETFTASAFAVNRGAAPTAAGLDTLNGKATYVGGAAGKYALASAIDGTNDAGHFTARATLEADFTVNDGTDTTTNGVTGTIDNFIGADGMPRNWSVELMGSPIADTGAIGDATATEGTEWTIEGTAAADSGHWSGAFWDTAVTDDDASLVPKFATGTFYSMYGTAGKMVGGFGVDKQ